MRNKLLLTSAVIALLAASCKNGKKSDVLVPKDAAVVIHIANSSLTSKLSWNEIKGTNWFQEMHKEADDTLARKLLSNPESAGIDLKEDMVFFMKKRGKGGYLVFEGNIGDAAAFESFNKQVGKIKEGATKEGELTTLRMSDNAIVSWNGSKFTYVTDAPTMNSEIPGMTSGEPAKFGVDSLKKFAKETLALDSDNSLGDDERFTDLLEEKGDVHVWMNSEHYYKGVAGGVMSMMKLNTLFQNNISASTLNFDNGKIAMVSRQYFSKEMAKLLEKHSPKPVSADLVNRIPSQNVLGAFVWNYPPEGLKELLTMTGMDGMANAFLSQVNYSVDELVQASGGEMLLSVSDFSMKQETVKMGDGDATFTSSKPSMNILFAASVNNKASFEKLIGIFKNQMSKEGKAPEVTFNIENNWFAASNSADVTNNFLKGGNNNVGFASKISGHPFGVYIDIQKIMKSAQPSVTSAGGNSAMNASLGLWQDVVIYGGKLKNGSISYQMEVNLVDKSTNSLKQLNKYIDQMAAAYKSERATVNGNLNAPVTVDTAFGVPAE